MTQPLNIKVDSGQARADLDLLAKSLDAAGAAAGRMSTGLSSGMGKADASIKGAMGNMEKFAQVSAALSKIKVDSSGTKAVGEFARVLGQVAKTAAIDSAKMASWTKFIEMGALTSRLKMDAGAANSLSMFTKAMDAASRAKAIDAGKMASWVKFIEIGSRASQLRMGATGMVGFTMFAQAMDNVSKAKAISAAKLKSWVDFIEVAARSQRLNFDQKTVAGLTAFGNAMAGLKAPGKASIERLQQLFTVLASAKRVPGARAIASDLEQIAMAAVRAAAAIDKLPASLRNMGGGMRGGGGAGALAGQLRQTASTAGSAGAALNKFGQDADKAGKHTYTMAEKLRGLNHRFDLSYQAGTIFSAMFASFTVGGFVKGIYDASVSLQKLEKAMLFSTRSYDGAKKATNEFIGTVYDMGLALDQVAEPFGRFTISAGAAGLSSQTSSAVFKSISQTLQVVGASAEQTGYAFYGLTQMIQKGKVSSEEFSRQIGEQIPGNAVAGARALSRMRGEAVSVAKFFDEMRKGNIMSADFVPIYAQELEKMFGPLMELIKDRPDIAINRLKTAFTVFQQAIGKASFIQEIGIQMNRLAETIGTTENGVFKLKPRFAELAKQLGQNLANMVRKAGDALVWLSENFEKVVFLAKMIATIYVATHFLSWSKAAITAVSGIQSLTKSLEGLAAIQQTLAATPFIGGLFGKTKAAQEAADIAKKNRQTARAVGIAASAAPLGGSMADIQNFRRARGFQPGADFRADMDRPNMFGRRATAMNGAGATAMAMGMRGNARPVPVPLGQRVRGLGTAVATGAGALATSARTAAPAAISGLAAMGKTLGLALGGLGIAAVATAATLAILSDKSTKLGDANIKFKDILTGAMSMIGSRVGDFFNRLLSGMGGVSGFLEKLGPAIKTVVDYLMVFGEIVGDTVGLFLHMGKALYLLLNGKPGEAKDEIDAIKRDWQDNNPFDQRNMENRGRESELAILTAAVERRDAEGANANSERVAREAAARLQEQAAANDQLLAAQMQLDAATEMNKAMEMPTMASVTERINNIASGAFARANPAQTAAQRAATNASNAAAAAPAAPAAGASVADGISTSAPQVLGSYSYQVPGGRLIRAATPEALGMAVYNEVNSRPIAPQAPQTPRPNPQVTGPLGDLRRQIRNVVAPTREQFEWDIAQLGAQRPRTPEEEAQLTRQRQADAEYQMSRARLLAQSSEHDARDAASANRPAEGSSLEMATEFLKKKEGFRTDAYWDVDHWRTGYGSDTTTSAVTGRKTGDVTRNTRITAADAEADLQRRLRDFQTQAANEIGQELWAGLSAGAQAGLTSTIYNYGTLTRTRNGRGAGIADEIRGGQSSPEQIADLVAGLARHGRGNENRRREEAEMIRTGRGVGGAAPAGAGGMTAADDAEDQTAKALAQKSNDWKSLQSVLALPDPASQAVARANALAEQLNDLAIRDEERIKTYGDQAKLLTQDVVDQIEGAKSRIFAEMSDALNPVAKTNRLLRQTNDLTLMTVRGMTDQAAWQEHLNDLKEQGYDISLMQDEARWQEHINRLQTQGLMVQADSLTTARETWELERKRERTLAAQVNLMGVLNEAELRRNARSGRQTQEEVYFNELVNQSSDSGTMTQKRARLEANPEELEAVRMTAQVQALSDRADALRALSVEASDAVLTTTMTAAQATFHGNFRTALEQITGLSNATMTELQENARTMDAGGDTFVKLAEGYAKLREELENQPGFARWADSLDPLAKRMEDIKGQFMEGLSDGITDSIMGEDVDWNAMWKNIRRAQVKAGVDSALASMTNFLSGRKPGEAALSPEARAFSETAGQQVAAIDRQTGDVSTRLQALLDAQEAQAAERRATAEAQVTAATEMTRAANALERVAAALGGDEAADNIAATAVAEATGRPVEEVRAESAARRAAAVTTANGRTPEELRAEAAAMRRQAVGPDAVAAAARLTQPTATTGLPTPGVDGWMGAVDDSWLSRLVGPQGDGVDATADVAARLAARRAAGGDATADVAARLAARRGSPSITLPTARTVQGELPAASGILGRTQDNRNLGEQALTVASSLFGSQGTVGGAEMDVRNSTAGAMGTAVTQGPTASFAASEGEDGGMSAAAEALYGAAQALMQVPGPFNEATSAYLGAIEKFAEAIKAMEAAISKMGSGGGGNPMTALTGGSLGEGVGVGSDGGLTLDLSTLTAATGGYITGPGSGTSDSINARLSNGEYVINAKATAQHRGLLEEINSGKAYATGGYVDGLPGFAGGGWFSNARNSVTQFGSRFKPSSMKNHFFGEGSEDMSMRDMGRNAFSGTFGKGKDDKYNGAGASFGQMFGKGNSMETRATGGFTLLNTLGTLAELFAKKDKPEADPKAVQGVIGEHRGVTVDATEIAAHENPWAMAINMAANMATGGQWDKARAYGEMAYGSVKSIGKAFAEGGYVSSGGASGMDWSSAPHYAEGTANTSGGMPAVVHPNEAIIPLSGGRKVPVDMSGMASERSISNNVTSNITVIAPNPDAFRKSQGSIQRQQNRDSRRAANRNLTP